MDKSSVGSWGEHRGVQGRTSERERLGSALSFMIVIIPSSGGILARMNSQVALGTFGFKSRHELTE